MGEPEAAVDGLRRFSGRELVSLSARQRRRVPMLVRAVMAFEQGRGAMS
jgi:hypothetical protein